MQGTIYQCGACGCVVRHLGCYKVTVGSGIRHHCPPGVVATTPGGSLIECLCGVLVELRGGHKYTWPSPRRHVCGPVEAPIKPAPKPAPTRPPIKPPSRRLLEQ